MVFFSSSIFSAGYQHIFLRDKLFLMSIKKSSAIDLSFMSLVQTNYIMYIFLSASKITFQDAKLNTFIFFSPRQIPSLPLDCNQIDLSSLLATGDEFFGW